MRQLMKLSYPNTLRQLYVVEALLFVCLLLSFITLFAGLAPHALQQAALLTVDTSSVAGDVLQYLKSLNPSATDTGDIPDWYEVHYLSICKGLWHLHEAARGRNASTTTCQSQSLGYSFSLSQALASDTVPAARQLFTNWTPYVLHTTAPAGLLIACIALAGLAWLLFLIGLIRTDLVNRSLQLNGLRVALMCSIAHQILLTNSAAQITARAQKLTGPVSTPVTVNAWKATPFYVLTWVDTGLAWLIVCYCIIVSFMIQRHLKEDEKNAVAAEDEVPVAAASDDPGNGT